MLYRNTSNFILANFFCSPLFPYSNKSLECMKWLQGNTTEMFAHDRSFFSTDYAGLVKILSEIHCTFCPRSFNVYKGVAYNKYLRPNKVIVPVGQQY